MVLDEMIGTALAGFEDWLGVSGWRGKEHDCVNLFAHGFLLRQVAPDGFLRDFTQVGIESAVPQPPGLGIKAACRKDLVIWGEPGAVTWHADWVPTRGPAAIIEWKARRRKVRAVLDRRDVEWLVGYTRHDPECRGYAVTVDFVSTPGRIASARIVHGQVTEDFHRVSTVA
jgi:hypothetical protein